MTRQCHDCGAWSGETPFPAGRKPYGQVDRCIDCAADPFEAQAERVALWRSRILELRQAGCYAVPKPVAGTPLFDLAAGRPVRLARYHAPPKYAAYSPAPAAEAAIAQEPAWTAPLFQELRPIGCVGGQP